MWVAFGVLGGVTLLGWLVMAGWVIARRPAKEVRVQLARALPDLRATLDAVARDEAIDAALRTWARRAGAYVASPIDLLPWPVALDDVVIALEALRSVHAAHGLEPIERAWPGDLLGWNALRAGLGLPREWELGAAA